MEGNVEGMGVVRGVVRRLMEGNIKGWCKRVLRESVERKVKGVCLKGRY